MKTLSGVLFVLLAIFIFSCASSTHIITGTPRNPIDPLQVRLYSKPPTNYDEIAIIEASSKNSWAASDQGKTEKVVKRLKKEAAALGANGVLLQGFGNEIEAMVGSGSATVYGTGSGTAYGTGNTMYVPVKHKSGKGLAIFVFDE